MTASLNLPPGETLDDSGAGAGADSGAGAGVGRPAPPQPAPAAARPEPARPTRRWPGRLLLGLAATWLGWVVAHLLLSGRVWWMLLPDLAPPLVYLGVPVVLLLAAGVAARQRARVLVLAGTALLLGFGQSGVQPGALVGGDRAVPAGALRVVSWNTQFWHQDEDPAAFYDLLHDFDADVYLLQEYLHFTDGPKRIDELAALAREFPGWTVVAESELVTISRLPVVFRQALDGSEWLSEATGSAPPPDTDFLPYWTTKTLRTDVQVGTAVVSLYNVHTPVQVDAERSPFTVRFYTVVREQAARRAASFAALHRDLARNPLPKVVAGDFNSTGAMQELSVLRDSLVEAPVDGAFYPTTWDARGRGWWLLDHVFSSADAPVHRLTIEDSRGLSDHRALVFRLSVDHRVGE